METPQLPIEVGFEKAKQEILQAIAQIGKSYDIPSSIMLLLIEQIVKDTRLNTYETILINYDIKIPEGVVHSQSKKPVSKPKPRPTEIRHPEIIPTKQENDDSDTIHIDMMPEIVDIPTDDGTVASGVVPEDGSKLENDDVELESIL